jgi:hypothetical protein
MSRSFVCCGTLVALALSVAGGAGAQPEADARKPAKEPSLIDVIFVDGSSVKMAIEDQEIAVATRYGKLTVPVAEIRMVQFGLRIPEATAKRIEKARAGLASDQPEDREAAGEELLKQREFALPALERATKDRDPLVARQAKELLQRLLEALPAEKASLKPDDRIMTADFTIVGRIEQPSLRARSSVFGETQLRVTDLRGMKRLRGTETQVVIDAAKYGDQNDLWMSTGIEVNLGSPLLLTASGSVDLWPTGSRPSSYMTGPEGNPDWSDGWGTPGERPAQSGMPPGALIGRIGPHGKAFLIGKRYEDVAREEGALMLRIVPSPWHNASRGSYKVAVTVGIPGTGRPLSASADGGQRDRPGPGSAVLPEGLRPRGAAFPNALRARGAVLPDASRAGSAIERGQRRPVPADSDEEAPPSDAERRPASRRSAQPDDAADAEPRDRNE